MNSDFCSLLFPCYCKFISHNFFYFFLSKFWDFLANCKFISPFCLSIAFFSQNSDFFLYCYCEFMSHDSFFFLALWEKSLNCEKKVTIIIFFNPWQKQAFIGLCFTVCSFLSDHKALPVLHKCQSGVVVMCVFVVTVSSSKSDSGSCFPECFAAVVDQLFLSLSLWHLIADAYSYSCFVKFCFRFGFSFILVCYLSFFPRILFKFHKDARLHAQLPRRPAAPPKPRRSKKGVCQRSLSPPALWDFTPISFLLLHQELWPKGD